MQAVFGISHGLIHRRLIFLQQAIEANSFFATPQTLLKGDPTTALMSADHVLQGDQFIGGQEHFYLETQACIAVPKGEDGEMEIFVASQGTNIPQVRRIFATG